MEVGDKVLLERETTKNRSLYDPDEYEITQVHGTQLTISRGDSILVRDSQKVKKVKPPLITNRFTDTREQEYTDPDIGCPIRDLNQGTPSTQHQVPPRSPIGSPAHSTDSGDDSDFTITWDTDHERDSGEEAVRSQSPGRSREQERGRPRQRSAALEFRRNWRGSLGPRWRGRD